MFSLAQQREKSMGKEKTGLKMVRSGEFEIATYGDNHCGTSDHFKVKYHLTCDCSARLDSRGFLFDQLNIQQYFESIKRTQLSCERLTVVCLTQLLEHILTENPTCEIRKMELTLSPEPFLASMTHSLETEGDDEAVLTLPKVKKTPLPKVRRAAKVDSPEGHPLMNLTGASRSEDTHHHKHGKPSRGHYLFEEQPK
jgi:hypothetical protein